MQEFIELKVFHGRDYPSLPASLASVVKDKANHYVFELPAGDPRWKEILAFCSGTEAWWRNRREHDKQRGVPQVGEVFGFQLLAEAITRSIEERGWRFDLPPDRGYLWALVKRRYSTEELHAAEVLHWLPRRTMSFRRPVGMDREIYDWDRQCRMCRAVPQVADLLFQAEHFPTTRDVLWVGPRNELVVSARVARILQEAGVSGVTTRRIWRRRRGAPRQVIAGWRQLVVTAEAGPLAPPTAFGADPFHLDPEPERCAVCGLTAGASVQSELYLPRASWDGSDVAVTRDRVGGRAGIPVPLLLISPHFYRLLLEHKIRGYLVEVAHLV